MEFRDREKRNLCYKARDDYYECHEKQDTKDDYPKACQELYKIFEETCGAKWTEHFVRRNKYLKFKQKLEKSGLDSLDPQQR